MAGKPKSQQKDEVAHEEPVRAPEPSFTDVFSTEAKKPKGIPKGARLQKFYLLSSTHTEPVYDDSGAVIGLKEYDAGKGAFSSPGSPPVDRRLLPVVESFFELDKMFANKFEKVTGEEDDVGEDVSEDFDEEHLAGSKVSKLRSGDYKVVTKTGEAKQFSTKREVRAHLKDENKKGV